MADTDGEEVDLAQQRRCRTRQIKAAGFLLEDVQELVRNSAVDTTSLSLLSEKGTALSIILQNGNKCMDLIRFEEEDEEAIRADKIARANFDNLTTQIRNICQEMGAVKRLTRTSKAIKQAVEKVEALVAVDPTKDYSDCFSDITYQMAVLTSGLFDSTIDPTHELWKEKDGFANKILELKSEKKNIASPVTVIKPEYDQDFNMPKVNIPKFKGVLETWHGFWNHFKAAVDENEQLKDPVKMAILIDLVADPALTEYLIAANDGKEGRYQQVIKYLQDRFDQPRELHSIHCKKLAEMQPIKGTALELSQAADTVFAAVEGIRRSGQANIDYLATSLVSSILPRQLRQEWETKTEEDPLVPNIEQWITFIRKKALHAGKGPTSAPAASSSRPTKDFRKEKSYNKSEGKVYVATSQPASEVESYSPRSKAHPKKTSSNSCKVQCSLCSLMHYPF